MRSMRSLCVLLALPIGLIMGCPPRTPPEEAVLAGTWLLETTAPGPLGEAMLVFNSKGDLASISIEAAEGVQIVRSNPFSNTTVNGDNVSIDVNLLIIGTLRFDGALNESQTVIAGELTTDLNLGLARIVIANGEATLTKVE